MKNEGDELAMPEALGAETEWFINLPWLVNCVIWLVGCLAWLVNCVTWLVDCESA